MKKLTVHDIFALKGKRQLIELLVTTPEEARAAEAVGIDLLITGYPFPETKEIRAAAPNTFLTMGIPHGTCASTADAIRAGFERLKIGADAVYTDASTQFIAAMAREGIPVIGHVGLVPSKATWTGGFKPVGKTAVQAIQVYQDVVAHQEAGAIGVECELVPHQIATEIARRVNICVISMGSGAGCDAQFLFAMDILGKHSGHIPRHAKVYRNHLAEYQRLYEDTVAAFTEFKQDIESGAFPAAGHLVPARQDTFAEFLAAMEEIL
jgi:3-methyl-2-oxobutanoate hydroxymethyltransferase